MVLSYTQKQDISRVFTRYAEGYRKKDIRAILELCSADIFGFGSGIDEVCEGRQQFKEVITRDLKQAEEVSVSFSGMKIYGDPMVAWTGTGCTFTAKVNGISLTMAGRMTAVLKNTGSKWLIEQIHFSMPFTGQDAGQSYTGLHTQV
jgi:ketosteroid isomerase-like protein